MVQSYREDSSVSEAGGLGRLGGLLNSTGKGLYTIGAIATAGAATLGSLATTLAGGWIYNLGAAISNGLGFGGATIGQGLLGAGSILSTGLVGVLGVMTAAGGVLKGVQSIRDGQSKKGIKEMIKGAAEGLFVGAQATMLIAGMPFIGGFVLIGAELISKVATGKTLTSHFGELVGTVLDAAMGTKENAPQRQNVNVMQAQGMGMQQQMGMAPQMMMPQPEYGQMMAPGGMAYSAVPAGVGMPQQMMQQPPQTYWQDQVAPQRAAQQQEPVMLTGAEAGRYTQAVDTAREAANSPEFNQYNKA